MCNLKLYEYKCPSFTWSQNSKTITKSKHFTFIIPLLSTFLPMGLPLSERVKGFLLPRTRLWSNWPTNGPQITRLQTLSGLSGWSACTCTLGPCEDSLSFSQFPSSFPLSLLLPPPPSPPLLFGVFKHPSTDMFWALGDPGARDPDKGRK